MPDNPPVFLTKTRQEVLNGTYEGKESSERTHKSRIRSQAKQALRELTAVAASPEIDNTGPTKNSDPVFEPDELARLLAAIISPPHKQITPRQNFDGNDTEYREIYEYPISVTWRLSHVLKGYENTLLQTNPSGDPLNDSDIDLISDE